MKDIMDILCVFVQLSGTYYNIVQVDEACLPVA